jgi:hypothetical protein
MAGASDPCSPVQYDRNRAALLEHLFKQDGRTNAAHPHAFTYTGLAVATRERLGAEALESWIRRWHEDPSEPVVDAPAGGEA